MKRLKNIFLKTIPDYQIWFEIECMVKSGLIDLSSHLFSKNLTAFNYVYLSLLLFNIYLVEFDVYLGNLSFCVILILKIIWFKFSKFLFYNFLVFFDTGF